MFMAAPFAQGPGGEENIRQLAARSPVRRLGVPADIAAVPLSGTIGRPVSPNS
jgi:hypothetical protein